MSLKGVIQNIGSVITGSWKEPFADADAIAVAAGVITKVGGVTQEDVEQADYVIDANGASVCPGFIDSQVHNTFGDYTPRQKTVGFLESYVHGGTTTAISASEVHVPGRPKDVEGVKALAVAAHKCFENFQPGGMRVHAGSVILEPGLTEADFQEIHDKGVWLAKAGFGAVKTPFDYAPMVKAARKVGMITTVHTGGASIPGSSAITGEHLMEMQPHVSFHINGGPVAMPEEHFEMIALESDIAMQVCTAGNLRTMLKLANISVENDVFHRFLIATDTPTGSGIMPLGMIYSMIYLSSLTEIPPEWFISASTGNVADIYGLNCGYVREGRDADLLIFDAPLGGVNTTALDAMKHGDPPAVAAVITNGIPRFVGRSRNTPAPSREISVTKSRVLTDFG